MIIGFLMLQRAYLSSRQLSIWSFRRDGLPQFKIAEKLGVTRQAVHNVIGLIDRKVSRALKDAANLNRIQIQHLDSVKGVLLGYHPEFKEQVIVSFSTRNGIQMWHKHTGRCGDCKLEKECRRILLAEAEERSVKLTEEDKRQPPAKLAHTVFSQVISELKS